MKASRSAVLIVFAFAIALGRVEAAPPAPAVPPAAPAKAATTATAAPTKPADPAAIEAERQKIWNSAAMLRARAWLEDYFEKSARITPKEAQEYRQHLEAMTPVQMKLWLMQFEEREQQRKQAEAAWQQAQQFSLQQNEAAIRAQQRALANPAPSGAAFQEEQRQGGQQALQNQMILQQKYGTPNLYSPYGFYPYGAYPFFYGVGPYPYGRYGY
jgi:hypothetical protein